MLSSTMHDRAQNGLGTSSPADVVAGEITGHYEVLREQLRFNIITEHSH